MVPSENRNSKIENGKSLIGYIVGGTLKESLRVRLTVPPQQIQEGAFITINSGLIRFYGLVTDLQLGATDPRFADEQSELRLPPELAALLHGQTLFTNLEVMLQLMREIGPELGSPDYPEWRKTHPNDPPLIPIKTIPAHHAEVHLATEGDIAEIFGDPDDPDNFVIGYTREQGYPVCLNLKKFVQRSSGIFGATGTGKSFLTRIILSGLINYNESSVLVFDMHNEYGFDDTSSDTNQKVPGLKTIFGPKVQMVGLGSGNMIRGLQPDFHLEIAESDIQPVDIEMLTRELNLKETTPTTLAALVKDFGSRNWFHEFKNMTQGETVENEEGKKVPANGTVEYWAQQANINELAATALHSKLGRLFSCKYIVDKERSAGRDPVREIINALSGERHVVLSFGDHDSDLDYLLVSNLLTRMIREEWEKRTNESRSKGKPSPRPLVIVIEEAHKLLSPEMASQTTFSEIAREMRKYYVTLLVIDQRPSKIYDEVMSQLGTRVSGWLGDENDIHAVLSGLAGREALRGMLSRLQPKEEVLMLGWGVPMPIPVRSRRYDENFVRQMRRGKLPDRQTEGEILKDLGFTP